MFIHELNLFNLKNFNEESYVKIEEAWQYFFVQYHKGQQNTNKT